MEVFSQSRKALVKTNREREESEALYDEAHDLAVDICDTVEFFYRKDPEPGRRREKCSRGGVVYIYEQNETAPASPANAGSAEWIIGIRS